MLLLTVRIFLIKASKNRKNIEFQIKVKENVTLNEYYPTTKFIFSVNENVYNSILNVIRIDLSKPMTKIEDLEFIISSENDKSSMNPSNFNDL